ncbi:MAG: hypothetical protein H8E38_10260 [SAR324 cluster bacterium]|nr:hypothetical protein [SAR324 cluster bacterium]MBL7035717.1 hypothetical protein [SAR324 cluster bacterium]
MKWCTWPRQIRDSDHLNRSRNALSRQAAGANVQYIAGKEKSVTIL